MTATILIVDDEPAILDTLDYALRTEGFRVLRAGLGQQALECALSQAPDLMVLDVGLPDMSGFDVCRALRRHSELPVLFLTARGDEIDRIVGLELGADDYVHKPFSPRELVSRVRAILRRTRAGGVAQVALTPAASAPASPTRAVTPAGAMRGEPAETAPANFQIDAEGLRVAWQGRWLELTRYEYGLFVTLLEQPGRVFSRARLMELVWREAEETLDRTVDAHVKTLRAKLKAAGAGDPIETRRGLGYCLRRDAA